MRSKAAVAMAAIIVGLGFEARAQSLPLVNQGNATVSVVDPKTLTVTAQIEERLAGKIHAHEAAVSPDGKTERWPKSSP
ncbi:hypothetical protein [Phenylobacterium montanum]|uniref:Uncharacterized protein n=1 Tax=Phenylobacterium montanum TaxID=2823693 RepID=A0A975G3U0_9CAUL|nr:hypothetical protein [Caulobacter sp. S6]QUD89501.1 hypothetical protein KCG34_06365 [Caulobacter sp. S6]